MFTDLVASTALFTSLGDEEAERVTRGHLDAVRSAVRRHDGQEVKSLGDGLMAVFTSAAQAVRAAADIQLDRGGAHRGVELSVRVGLATGDAREEDGDFHGLPVITASRLCDAAEANQILVTDVVRSLAASIDEVTFGSTTERTLKGLDAPIGVVEVVPQPRPASADGDRAAFVGRSAELGELLDAFADAAHGELTVALVTGEPGIGKTLLVEQLVAEVGRNGTVLWGRCWDGDDAPALWPWRGVFQGAVDVAGELGSPELAAAAAELLDAVTHGAPPSEGTAGVDAEGARLQLYERACRFVLEASEVRPVVVVIDDLHWADDSSLALFRYLAREARPQRTLLIGIFRDTESQEDLLKTAAAAARARRNLRLRLEGLSGAEGEDLVRRHLDDPSAADLGPTIVDVTAGNPFYIAQIARLVAERPVSVADGPVPLPSTVVDVVRERVSALPDGCDAVLEVAAVIGRDFRHDLLGRVRGMRDLPVDAALDHAERAGLIVPGTPPSLGWRFAHDVLRSVLYDGLGTARRAQLHLEVADALLAAGDPEPITLAHHLALSSAPDGRARAAAHARQAAERARELAAHEDAARNFALARELLGSTSDGAQRVALLIDEAEQRFVAADVVRGRAVALEAADLARDLRDAEALARAALVLSVPGSRFVDDPEAVDLLEEAISWFPADDVGVVPLLEARLAMEICFVDRQRALDLSARLVAEARARGDRSALLSALVARRYAIWVPDRVDELVEVGSELLALAEDLDRPDLALHGHYTRRAAYDELGDVDAADREMRQVELLSRRHAFALPKAFLAGRRSMRSFAAGRLDEAGVALDEALLMCEQVQDDQLSVVFLALQVELAREGGRFESAVEVLEFASAFRPDHLLIRAGTLCTRALMGQEVDRGALRAVVDGLGAGASDWLWLGAVSEACIAAHRTGDVEAAGPLLQLLEPYVATNRAVMVGPMVTLGAVAHFAGLAVATMGDHARAVELFTRAAAESERQGAVLCALRSITASIDVLGQLGDDGGRGPSELRAAIEHGRRLAAQVDDGATVDAFRRVVAVIDHPVEPPPAGVPGGLTSREVEVLRLVASGATNKVIAETLHLSVKTVERHLANTYTKLGVRNRAEAATWASREGILPP